MNDSLLLGSLLVAAGGILLGLFSLPVTKTPRWTFEQVWGAGSLMALVLLPWPVALLTVPHLGDLYSSASTSTLVIVFLCGVGWGLGGIFWGKAISALGMALGVSLLMGLINVFGSIGPLAVFEPAKLGTSGGLTLMLALAIMIGGVILIARAGQLREQEQKATEIAATAAEAGSPSRASLSLGLLFCLLSGILSALVNFGFIYGRPLTTAATEANVPGYATSFHVWSLVFTGNYLVNTIYAFIEMARNGTLRTWFERSKPSYWAGAIFMGLAWPGGILVYGIGANLMGPYGAYAGFPMMILASILAGNLAGALGGEWKGSQRPSRLTMTSGVAVLFVAFVVLGISNRLF